MTPFSYIMRSSGEKHAIFELRNNRAFESCSNIPFPLSQKYIDRLLIKAFHAPSLVERCVIPITVPYFSNVFLKSMPL